MDLTVLDAIHAWWFGELKAYDDQPPEERRKEWFRPSAETDAYIRDTWGSQVEEARVKDWDLDALSRSRQVALVVMLDQFPRQIHRKSGEAFACDAVARAIARRLVAGNWRRFFMAEQGFVFLPFEHSEALADQDMSVLLCAERAVEAPDSFRAAAREGLDYATRHRDVIRRFGRFPHRNEMLGRASTPEEVEFLKGGRGF